MADSIDQFAILLNEAISPSIVDLTLPDDDVLWPLCQTFPAVDSAGRDTNAERGAGESNWFAEYNIKVQRGGTIEGANFGGNTMTTTGAYNELFVGQSINSLYPDPALAAMPSWIKCRLQLRRVKGLIPMNKDQILARLATNPMDEVVADATEDAVRLYRGNFTCQGWADGSAQIARADGGTTITESAPVYIDVKEGSPYRFMKGQKYVIGSYVAPASYGSSARTARQGDGANPTTPASIVYCVGIQKQDRKVGFQSAPGEGDITVTDGDAFMLYNMYDFNAANVSAGTRAMEGLESLVIQTGNFPGATLDVSGTSTPVTVDNVPELEGFVDGDEDNPVLPTPELIAELIDLQTDGMRKPPPVMVAEQSVWTLWSQLERNSFASYQVPQGSTFQASGGVNGPMLSHGNNTFTRLNSNQCRTGAVHGISPQGMLKFMPMGGDTIKWFFSGGVVSGASSIFGPTASGRQWSELFQAPFDGFGQLGCRMPGDQLRRIGLYSQRTYNAA